MELYLCSLVMPSLLGQGKLNLSENKCIRFSSVGKLTALPLYGRGSGVRLRSAGKRHSLGALRWVLFPVKEAEA